MRVPYVNEEELTKQLLRLIEEFNEKQITLSEKVQGALLSYQKVVSGSLMQEDIEIEPKSQGIKGYIRYVLKKGSTKEKADLMKGLHIPLILHDGAVQIIQK